MHNFLMKKRHHLSQPSYYTSIIFPKIYTFYILDSDYNHIAILQSIDTYQRK